MSNEKVHPLPGNKLRKINQLNGESNTDNRCDGDVVGDLDAANVVTSEMDGPESELPILDSYHRPVLDIDLPAQLIPSSTPGHHHLLLDVKMTWMQYEKLLEAMRDAGILEPGYVAASIRRRYTAVRLPWVRKGDAS